MLRSLTLRLWLQISVYSIKVYNCLELLVKSRPELHYCVVVLLVLRDHGVYMYVVYIWIHLIPLMRKGASMVWHHSLLLMNSFNKTEAAVFSFRLCFLRAFPFVSFFIFKLLKKMYNESFSVTLFTFCCVEIDVYLKCFSKNQDAAPYRVKWT